MSKTADTSSMALKYDKKIQLEILDEINEKSDGENPVNIDLTDPVRQYNAEVLWRDGCLNVSIKDNPYREGTNFEPWIFGLLDKGYKVCSELAEDLEKMELRRQEVKAFMGANTRATWMMWIAIICALISTPSWIFVIEFWCKWLQVW